MKLEIFPSVFQPMSLLAKTGREGGKTALDPYYHSDNHWPQLRGDHSVKSGTLPGLCHRPHHSVLPLFYQS